MTMAISKPEKPWRCYSYDHCSGCRYGPGQCHYVAGAAKHNMILVTLGLLISVPIVVWGSTLFIKLINRFPWIIYVGSAVLAYTASSMITEEKHFLGYFEAHQIIKYLFIAAIIVGVLTAGHLKRSAGRRQSSSQS